MNDTNLMQLMKFIDVSQLHMFRAFVPIIRSTRPVADVADVDALSRMLLCYRAATSAKHTRPTQRPFTPPPTYNNPEYPMLLI
jgi:hypothetical protein